MFPPDILNLEHMHHNKSTFFAFLCDCDIEQFLYGRTNLSLGYVDMTRSRNGASNK